MIFLKGNLIKDIAEYIDYLRGECNLAVTVHPDFMSLTDGNPYNVHYTPYCIAVKNNMKAWDRCIECQSKVYEKCKKGAFWGMCYAGVEEYVLPVRVNGMAYGFVSVSGYATEEKEAEKRRERVAADFGINKEILDLKYNELKKQKPDLKRIDTLVKPLCYMLELLWENGDDGSYKPYFDRTGADYVLGRILSYAQYNFSEKTSLEKIAKFCNCSTSYVSHLFKKRYGVGVNTYINKIRIENAKNLLKNSDYSIAEIASRVGFSDSNYFTNIFKEYAGSTPTEYRRNENV